MLEIDKKYAKKYVGDRELKAEVITKFKTLRLYIFNEVNGVSVTMYVTTPTSEEGFEERFGYTFKYQKRWTIKSEIFKDGKNTIRVFYYDNNKYREIIKENGWV